METLVVGGTETTSLERLFATHAFDAVIRLRDQSGRRARQPLSQVHHGQTYTLVGPDTATRTRWHAKSMRKTVC